MAFMPGQDLIDDTYELLNLINLCKENKRKTKIISLAITKAFDSIKIPFLKNILHYTKFGNKFLYATQATYFF